MEKGFDIRGNTIYDYYTHLEMQQGSGKMLTKFWWREGRTVINDSRHSLERRTRLTN